MLNTYKRVTRLVDLCMGVSINPSLYKNINVFKAYHAHTGAFAEYTAAVADITWKKPEHLSFEELAPFGVGCNTAAAALYQRLGLPTPSKPAETPFPVSFTFVYC